MTVWILQRIEGISRVWHSQFGSGVRCRMREFNELGSHPVRLVGVVLFLFLVVAAVAVPGAVADDATEGAGTVTVTPDTGLVDEQVVTVAGSAVTARARVQVSQCRAPGTDEDDCRVPFSYDDTTDSSGNFSMSARLEANFAPWRDAQVVDCRTAPGACVLRLDLVIDEPGATTQTEIIPLTYDASAPLASPPTMDVAPSTGLRDAQSVEVTGAGWSPDDGFIGGVVVFSTCTTPTFTHGACARPAVDDEPAAFVDGDGTFIHRVRLRAAFGTGPNRTDCRTTTCYLVASEEPSFGDQTSMPLEFDPDAPLFDGQIRISAAPNTGLTDGQVVTADISGFFPEEHPAILLQCAEDAAGDFLGCTGGQTHTAGLDGTLRLPFAVHEQFEDRSAEVDCLVHRCFLGTGRPSGRFPEVRAHLTFAGRTTGAPATPTVVEPAFTG